MFRKLLTAGIIAASLMLNTSAVYAGTFSVVGDSITYGYTLPSQDYSYANILARKIGAASFQNLGVCGSCIAVCGINYVPDIIERTGTISADADRILIMAGTNDFGVNNTPMETFISSYKTVIENIKTAHPNAEIILATPLKRTYGSAINAQGLTLRNYVDAVRAVGAVYGLSVIDLYDSIDLTAHMPDGLHPDVMGSQLLADYLALQISG